MTDRIVDKSPVFYGWVVMAVATLGLVMTSPGQSYVVSVFIEHFIHDLGLSRSVVSTLYTAATLGGSLALPFVGRQIDKYGPRSVVTVVAFSFGLACLLMGNVTNTVMLGLGFLAIRFLGQGSLGLVSLNVINQWWITRRGMVMGISGLCVSLFGLGLFPVAVNHFIPILGWRGVYMAMGGLLILGMAPLGYLFFRDKPEKLGLQPDGGFRTQDAEEDAEPIEENWTLAEAIRTSAFWVVAGSAGTVSMLTTGIVFHVVSIFADQGHSANTAASIFVPLSITMAAVNLGGGFLADRIPTRILLAFTLLLQAGLLFLALNLDSTVLVLVFGVAMGATMGLYRVIMSVLWANYFGRLHLGAITGLAQTIAVGSSALGPMPFGIAHDAMGTYETAFFWTATIPLFFSIANLFVGPPKRAVTH